MTEKKKLTTNAGAPVVDNQNTMTAGSGSQKHRSDRIVRKNTLQIAEDIPEAPYSFTSTPDTRSVRRLLIHVALGYRFQQQFHATECRTTLAGFDFPALIQRLGEEEAKPWKWHRPG
jgi:hypothetical protein